MIENGLCNNYERKSKWAALSFISIAFITLLYTFFSAISVSTVLASALFTSGLFSLYYTSKENASIPASWFRSLLYLSAGVSIFFISSELSVLLFSLLFALLTLNSLFFTYLTRQNATAFAWLLDTLINAFFTFYLFLNSEINITTVAIFISIHLISGGLVLLYSGRKIFIRP